MNFVNAQGYKYKELASCFIVFGIKKKLDGLLNSKKTNANISAVDFFFHDIDTTANLALGSAINTQSNLGSAVFENIAISIGIDASRYMTRYNLIDKSLLYRRNNIAHGIYLDITLKDFRNLSDEVIKLLKDFKTDIENAASLASYKR